MSLGLSELQVALAMSDLEIECNVCGGTHTLMRHGTQSEELRDCLERRFEHSMSSIILTPELASLHQAVLACHKRAQVLCDFGMFSLFKKTLGDDIKHACLEIYDRIDMLARYLGAKQKNINNCESVLAVMICHHVPFYWVLTLSPLKANHIIGILYLREVLTFPYLWGVIGTSAEIVRKNIPIASRFLPLTSAISNRACSRLLSTVDELIACKGHYHLELGDELLSMSGGNRCLMDLGDTFLFPVTQRVRF